LDIEPRAYNRGRTAVPCTCREWILSNGGRGRLQERKYYFIAAWLSCQCADLFVIRLKYGDTWQQQPRSMRHLAVPSVTLAPFAGESLKLRLYVTAGIYEPCVPCSSLKQSPSPLYTIDKSPLKRSPKNKTSDRDVPILVTTTRPAFPAAARLVSDSRCRDFRALFSTRRSALRVNRANSAVAEGDVSSALRIATSSLVRSLVTW
jgi:hypothetical protein